MIRLPGCACPEDCPEFCTEQRSCAAECPCYDLWALEVDLAREQTAHLTAEELHRLVIEAWG